MDSEKLRRFKLTLRIAMLREALRAKMMWGVPKW